jgi:hypothetical protein
VNDCYTVTITDSFDDGICCDDGDGSFEVYFEGQEVFSGGDFGSVFRLASAAVRCLVPPQALAPLHLRAPAP